MASNSEREVWLINGKSLVQEAFPEESLWVARKYSDIFVVWLPIPEKGELELIGGMLRGAGTYNHDPVNDRKALLAAGAEPFRIDVKDIPTINVKSLDDLPKALGLTDTTTQPTSTSATHPGNQNPSSVTGQESNHSRVVYILGACFAVVAGMIMWRRRTRKIKKSTDTPANVGDKDDSAL